MLTYALAYGNYNQTHLTQASLLSDTQAKCANQIQAICKQVPYFYLLILFCIDMAAINFYFVCCWERGGLPW